jgi:hypothetical protein
VVARRVWRNERDELRAEVALIGPEYAFACVGEIMVEWYRDGRTRVETVWWEDRT